MQTAIVISGRLVGPRSVELDEPVGAVGEQVEVILRRPKQQPSSAPSFPEFVSALPPGTRTRAEIDEQIAAERGAWESPT